MGLTKLGIDLKMKLIEENKTQTWLAKQLGVSKQLLNNCIHGESNFNLEERLKKYIQTGEVK